MSAKGFKLAQRHHEVAAKTVSESGRRGFGLVGDEVSEPSRFSWIDLDGLTSPRRTLPQRQTFDGVEQFIPEGVCRGRAEQRGVHPITFQPHDGPLTVAVVGEIAAKRSARLFGVM
jgi:hypothetical protein